VIGLTVSCRVTLSFVLGAAFLGKVTSAASFLAFRHSLDSLPWLPPMWRRGTATTLVAIEGMTAALLLVPDASVGALIVASLLLTTFTGVLAIAMARKQGLTCHCFGLRGTAITWMHVFRNGALLAIALSGLTITLFSTDAMPTSALVEAVAAGSGLLAGCIFVGWDEFAFLLRTPPAKGSHTWKEN